MAWSLPNNDPGMELSYAGFLEPGHFLMERKMLLGIKQRAETTARRLEASPESSPAVEWQAPQPVIV